MWGQRGRGSRQAWQILVPSPMVRSRTYTKLSRWGDLRA